MGYKVQIERFNCIPSIIKLVGKTSKIEKSGKHVSNNRWKCWHARVNIQVSSNSLPFT
jgi:hypothetical protein